MIFLAVMIALEIVFNLRPEARNDYYDRWLGIWWPLWAGELWRPFTSSLMHINLIHLAFNGFWLAVFGPVLEERFGSWRTFGLIVLLAYVSGLPGYIADGYLGEKPHGSVGFSGVGYGLFGLILSGRRYVPKWWAVCDQQTVNLFIGWFFFCVFLTLADAMPVDNVAHGAGFVFGVLYGQAIFDRIHRAQWVSLATVLTLAVLATMVACPGHVHYEYVRRIGRTFF